MKKKYEKVDVTVYINGSDVILTSGDPDNLEGTYSDPYVLG